MNVNVIRKYSLSTAARHGHRLFDNAVRTSTRSPQLQQSRSRGSTWGTHSLRSASTSASLPAKEFIIHCPDHPGVLSKRQAAKSAHLAAAMPLIESGQLSYFGVTLAKEPSSVDDSQEINGSIIVIRAESEAWVKEFLARDAYTAAGVWDLDKAQIWSFKSG